MTRAQKVAGDELSDLLADRRGSGAQRGCAICGEETETIVSLTVRRGRSARDVSGSRSVGANLCGPCAVTTFREFAKTVGKA